MSAQQSSDAVTVEGIRTDPRKAALRIARLQRQAVKAYGERDELLVFISRLYDSHLMPITRKTEAQTWKWALCIHAGPGKLIYKLDNETADAKFSHLERIDEDHYTKADDMHVRTLRLTDGV